MDLVRLRQCLSAEAQLDRTFQNYFGVTRSVQCFY